RPAPPRSPSLFERVTMAARNNRPTASPAAPPAPAPAPQPAPKAFQPEPAPAAAQPQAQARLAVDRNDRLQTSRTEEDLLDIPAFLRRQAN
ncbi:MAG: cell division protein FtsZ, partial [Rhodospirillales bacterium]|nr:cell division protein FtsZ [Rhodospirillales bacterium]